ncbi:MAG: DUF3349 domain-containing protein [Mycobacterium sp.]
MVESFFESVLRWLHQSYPQGVPQKDCFPLLALLKRTLTEEEVVRAAQTLLREGDTPITTEQIHQTIHEITEQEPNPEEIHQVASRLASVGWPLAAAAR